MNNMAKLCLAVGLCAASASASAIEAHVIVWADVDPTLSLLKADGTALDDSVELAHRAGSGLTSWNEQVRIYSNDTDKDVEVRLARALELVPTNAGPTAVAVPMKVTLNSRELTTVSENFTAAELFTGAINGGSIEMPLVVGQAALAPIAVAGKYEGLLSLVLNQKAATP
ncbi:CS1 type fimbrial major subunit [Stenotrophomonas sp. TWI700]|uniref:CS1 type fimbrial major subunit n=1 Tax=Stenotrophomonas sp. TWI700 TaxID=3136792 RepID=UPI00320AE29E